MTGGKRQTMALAVVASSHDLGQQRFSYTRVMMYILLSIWIVGTMAGSQQGLLSGMNFCLLILLVIQA